MIGSQEAHMHSALVRNQYQQIRQRKPTGSPSGETQPIVGSVEHKTKQALVVFNRLQTSLAQF